MPILQVLTPIQQKKFDACPLFNSKQREKYFSYNDEIIDYIDKIIKPENQVGFLIQLGYFRASGKFFSNKDYRSNDIKYCCNILEIEFEKVSSLQDTYSSKARTSHKRFILNYCGWKSFSKGAKLELKEQLLLHARQQMHPEELFPIATKYLINRRIELPLYYLIADIITDIYNEAEDKLTSIIDKTLLKGHKKILDDLIWIDDKRKKHHKYSALSKIKSLSYSTKIKDIEESIKNYRLLKAFYNELITVYNDLGLTESATSYYSAWVSKSKLFQLKQFKNRSKAYLYLLAHIKHQYHLQTDMYIEIMSKLITNANNSISKKIDTHNNNVVKKQKKFFDNLANLHIGSKQAFQEILNILNNYSKSPGEKDLAIREIAIHQLYDADNIVDTNLNLEEYFEASASTSNLKYKLLSKMGASLQRKLAPIITELSFSHQNKNSNVMRAITDFIDKNGKPSKANIKSFLTKQELNLISPNKSPNLLAYKGILFNKILSSIKAAELTVNNSYNFLPLDRYFISNERWSDHSDIILESCGLERFKDIDKTLSCHSELIDAKYNQINNDHINGANKDLKIKKDGKFTIKTSKANANEKRDRLSNIFTQDGIIGIPKLLDDINNVTNFVKCFKHHSNKSSKMKPTNETIYAGLISKGCNHGSIKMANISKGISKAKLNNTINWFFSLENIQLANNSIINFIDKLPLPNVYRINEERAHTSSDGQKFNVGVDSILANYSFKYFGQSQGISVYTFIDDRHVLFYDTILSPGEREAAFVIDGIMANNVIKSHIHSTDTHGYSEAIFAVMHLLGVSFAPRIKKLGSQQLYSISSLKKHKKDLGHIKPNKKINIKLIKDNWGDILKLIATIKSKTTTASQIFKRLNSYTKEVPLYRALKEFGRIIKTSFILTYIDDSLLRMQIEKQLNKIESSNKFAKAVFFANSQEFRTGSSIEQKVIVSCKTFLQNCIVLWNYLYLSQTLINLDTKERNALVQTIKQGSVVTWQHINLHGEYDFTVANEDSGAKTEFEMDKIQNLQVLS